MTAHWRIAPLAISALLSLATSGRAADAPPPPVRTCALPELASIDMRTRSDGQFSVPVEMNGHPFFLLVDTGSVHSSMTYETASELGVKLSWTPYGGAFLNNIAIDEYTTLTQFKLGPLRSDEKLQVLVIPNDIVPASTAGLLGPDIMASMDVEFDFYRGKFNLFEHNACDGHVVYWTHDPYAALPIKLDRHSFHVDVEAVLDGKPLMVTFDTGSGTSTMSLEAARELFGWDEKDPRVKYVGKQSLNGGEESAFYTFPFGTLSFDGVTVSNPQITLIPNDHFFRERNHDAVIILGMSVIRQLHMYVDYQGSMLYLTGAEAH
ncbi:MAG TPA: pepsin/retropepsin-like aspartic protease family protein [Rhizomicrobium sp.]|nr:pepsin/retropepsin-like aspartic protease family protein [Rhizomicrobium sp.]